MEKRIPTQSIYDILSHLVGTVGVYIKVCKTQETLVINPDRIFPCASVIKIPMLGLLLRDGLKNKVMLDVPHSISEMNYVGGTGILNNLDHQFKPTLRDLGKLMIMMSDNTATNEVMDVIGVERFEEFCQSEGYPNIIWQRKMMDFQAIKEGKNNYMCVGEIGDLLYRISTKSFISPEISECIFNYMCEQKYRNKLPSLIPAVASYSGVVNEIPEGQVLVGNKTGDLVGIQHDVGIFELPNHDKYVIAVFTGNLQKDIDGITAIGKISEVMYDAMK
ncbi:serine hydrolase [Acidaminococcus timonensis]|uniref:serine hydrolase n=1 Tax=Acidaminococcus timonensis TaxID=1871002 RepID=UPI003A5BE625